MEMGGEFVLSVSMEEEALVEVHSANLHLHCFISHKYWGCIEGVYAYSLYNNMTLYWRFSFLLQLQ